MALRFLADHCISNSTVQNLPEAHYEVLRLKDPLPVESSDTIVIAKAQEIDAILVCPDTTEKGKKLKPNTHKIMHFKEILIYGILSGVAI
jgi:hypothetical protein